MTYTPARVALTTSAAATFCQDTRENGGATIRPAYGEILPIGNGGAESSWIVGVRTDVYGVRIPTEFVYLTDLTPECVAGFVTRVHVNTNGATDATAGSWILEDPTTDARAEAARHRSAITGRAHTDNPDLDGPVVALDHGSFLPYFEAVKVARENGEESIFGPASISTRYTGLNNAGAVVNALDNAATTLDVAYYRATNELALDHILDRRPRSTGPVARYMTACRVARATLARDADSRALALSLEYVAQCAARADA